MLFPMWSIFASTGPTEHIKKPQRGLYNQLKLIGINNFVQDINWLSIDTLEIKGGKIILMIPINLVNVLLPVFA